MRAMVLGVGSTATIAEKPVSGSKEQASSGPPNTFKASIASIPSGYAALYEFGQNLTSQMVPHPPKQAL
jgi:hypothetical protein